MTVRSAAEFQALTGATDEQIADLGAFTVRLAEANAVIALRMTM